MHLCRRSLALAGVVGSGGGSGSDMRSDSALSSAASGSDPYSDDGSASAAKTHVLSESHQVWWTADVSDVVMDGTEMISRHSVSADICRLQRERLQHCGGCKRALPVAMSCIPAGHGHGRCFRVGLSRQRCVKERRTSARALNGERIAAERGNVHEDCAACALAGEASRGRGC